MVLNCKYTALKESSTDNSTDASSNLNRRPKQFDGSGDGNTDLDEPEGIVSGGQIHNRLLFDYQWFKCTLFIPSHLLPTTNQSFSKPRDPLPPFR